MTQGILAPEALSLLEPNKVSAGLLALVGEEAPTRKILCAGAGHFATAHVTLTAGAYVGDGPTAAQDVMRYWDRISKRDEEIVPAYGFTQAEMELKSAGYTVPIDGISN
jgi:hypothetical protein